MFYVNLREPRRRYDLIFASPFVLLCMEFKTINSGQNVDIHHGLVDLCNAKLMFPL